MRRSGHVKVAPEPGVDGGGDDVSDEGKGLAWLVFTQHGQERRCHVHDVPVVGHVGPVAGLLERIEGLLPVASTHGDGEETGVGEGELVRVARRLGVAHGILTEPADAGGVDHEVDHDPPPSRESELDGVAFALGDALGGGESITGTLRLP